MAASREENKMRQINIEDAAAVNSVGAVPAGRIVKRARKDATTGTAPNAPETRFAKVRLATLEEAWRARKRVPNTFDYWAYDREE